MLGRLPLETCGGEEKGKGGDFGERDPGGCWALKGGDWGGKWKGGPKRHERIQLSPPSYEIYTYYMPRYLGVGKKVT